jgi:hypothetical protein
MLLRERAREAERGRERERERETSYCRQSRRDNNACTIKEDGGAPAA